ncbi:MAG: Protein TraM [Legionella sp.]|uniref:conjugal transfer protein TraM n=1 Tax=Legionella sp. TaxID=459 RepID=UPI003D132ED2
MSEELDHLIKEIAVKHGTVLGKDDPILMLHTVNQQLIEDSKKAHQELLMTFKGELELCCAKWKEDAHEKAEKIVNASLASSKEIMSRLVQKSSEHAIHSIQEIMTNTINELNTIRSSTKIYSITALFASGIMIVLVTLLIVFNLI